MAALRLQALNIHNVGRQWFKTCGAASKKETSATSYTQYLKTDELEELKDDVKQIAKDVTGGRTDPECFSDPVMRLACKDCSRDKLTRILTAYIRRNPCPGYAQGMNFIASFLLACTQQEEDTFWILCTIVEQLRDADFYARPPAAMNGFVAESEVMTEVTDPFPSTL